MKDPQELYNLKRMLDKELAAEKKPKYLARLRLDNQSYLAVLSNALVLVQEDESGNPIKWVILGNDTLNKQ